MSKARYEIHVPNHVRHVGIAAHQYLTNGAVRGINAATLSFGHPHDSLSVIGDESPELDSHMKQTGTFIGDVANVPVIDVLKHGKNIAHWPMRNQNYRPEPVQAPAAFSGPQEAPLPSAGPQPGVAS